jgi:hypothetical protein
MISPRVEKSGRFAGQSHVHFADGAAYVVSVNEVLEIRDLRDSGSWSTWVDSQEEDVRAMLGMAAFAYNEPTDSIYLVFANSALRCMTESTCERIVELIRSFYDVRLQAWLAGRHQIPPDEYPPRQAVMPHLSIEIAPPFTISH